MASLMRSQSSHANTRADLPLEIWMEIFRYATYVHRTTNVLTMDPFTPDLISTNVLGANTPILSMQTKCTLVLVSRQWRQVANELLYEHIVISSPNRAKRILAALQGSAQAPETQGEGSGRSLGFGRYTRSIEVFTHARGALSLQFLQCVFLIFQHCPNLHTLGATWEGAAQRNFLLGIARLYGPTLKGLHWREKSEQERSTVLGLLSSLHALRVLNLKCYTPIEEEELAGAPLLASPRVEDLSVLLNANTLTLALNISLPALRRLTAIVDGSHRQGISTLLPKFLLLRGANLAHLEIVTNTEPPCLDLELFLKYCPNLIDLVFHKQEKVMNPLAEPHQSLRRIGLRGVRDEGLYPSKQQSEKLHLLSFTRASFPALEVVRTIGFLVESSVDIQMKDIFIWWTEHFETEGIDFQDGGGIVWLYTDPLATPTMNRSIASIVNAESETSSNKEDALFLPENPQVALVGGVDFQEGRGGKKRKSVQENMKETPDCPSQSLSIEAS